jgi:hypothetical protein
MNDETACTAEAVEAMTEKMPAPMIESRIGHGKELAYFFALCSSTASLQVRKVWARNPM